MEATAQGVLSKTPLAHLIVYCLEKKLRGTLILRPEGNDDNAVADVVSLVDGMPAKIRIADQVEHLGRVLLELGAIDDVAFNDSLMALGRKEGLQGQILMQRGRIDAATLERGLRTQIARKLGILFTRAPTTRYAYYDAADFLQRYGGPELFPVDPTPVIFASIRSNPSMSHAEATIERVATMQLRIRPGADPTKLDLTRAENEIVSKLRATPMTAAQIASEGDARTAKLLTYGLLLLKMVEPIGAPAARPAAASPAPPPAPTPAPAAPAAPAAPSGDPQRRAEILAKAKSIDTESFFQILGIPRESTADDAKNAYFQLVKRWHPDRLPADLMDLKDDVARVFALMADAYQTLTDSDRRTRYLQDLNTGGGTPQDQEEVARIMEASNAFQKADFYVGKGQLAEAEPYANKAFSLEPNDADHVAIWCWIQANKPERRESAKYEDLIGKLEKALIDNAKNERARFYRGMLLKLAGRMGEAIRDFREVAESNPRHVEAVREVRLYTMRHERDRRNKDEGSGSLLGKFMKKK
jgi:curved DNA-binding protein CbpA